MIWQVLNRNYITIDGSYIIFSFSRSYITVKVQVGLVIQFITLSFFPLFGNKSLLVSWPVWKWKTVFEKMPSLKKLINPFEKKKKVFFLVLIKQLNKNIEFRNRKYYTVKYIFWFRIKSVKSGMFVTRNKNFVMAVLYFFCAKESYF